MVKPTAYGLGMYMNRLRMLAKFDPYDALVAVKPLWEASIEKWRHSELKTPYASVDRIVIDGMSARAMLTAQVELSNPRHASTLYVVALERAGISNCLSESGGK